MFPATKGNSGKDFWHWMLPYKGCGSAAMNTCKGHYILKYWGRCHGNSGWHSNQREETSNNKVVSSEPSAALTLLSFSPLRGQWSSESESMVNLNFPVIPFCNHEWLSQMHTKLRRSPVPQTGQVCVVLIPCSIYQADAGDKVKKDNMVPGSWHVSENERHY